MKDVTSSDVARFARDVASGKSKIDIKTKKRGRAIVRGGLGTASRAIGLLGGIFTYAIEQAIIDQNPAHGVRKAADRVKNRRLSEDEYRVLGQENDPSPHSQGLSGLPATRERLQLCRSEPTVRADDPSQPPAKTERRRL